MNFCKTFLKKRWVNLIFIFLWAFCLEMNKGRRVYMLPSIKNKNSIFEAPFSILGKRSISNESWTFHLQDESSGEFTACETVAEDAFLFRLVNYLGCLLRSKTSALQKWVGDMWYFQRNCFIYKVKILKEVRFLENLLILLEIQFVWNNGG